MASTQISRTAICKAALTKLVDAAPIGLFRILFGLLMVVEVLRYWAYGPI